MAATVGSNPELESEAALKKSMKNTPDSEYDAIAEFERICRSDTASEETKITAWQRLGCSYFKVKNYHAAIFAFDKTIECPKKYPATIYAHVYKGEALLKIRKYRDARAEFFNAINTISKLTAPVTDDEKSYLEATALHQIGISLSQTDDDDEAMEYFDKAISLSQDEIEKKKPVDPHGISQKIEKVYHTARISRSFSLCRAGRLEEARNLLRITMSDLEGPGNSPYDKYRVSVQNVLGIIHLCDTEEENSGPEALAAFNKAIEIAKNLNRDVKPLYIWKGYYNKGLALKNAQKYNDAITCFSEGLKECKEFEPHLMYARGITKIELQKFEEGIQDLQAVQNFDPRYSPAIIALGDAYRKQSVYYHEVELQKQLLDSTTAAVGTTQQNLKDLSDDMRRSLRHVSWMFYILFFAGLGVFLGCLVYTGLRYPNIDLLIAAISVIGGIDVILSMMFLSPTKIQKNRIDYSQWLMGYFNWVNTQFAASTVMLERLQNVHSPSKPATEEFNWEFAQPVYSFLNAMTKETLETIDKCCEFPDVQYSLSKKAESKTADKDAKAAEAKEAEKPSVASPADSGKKLAVEAAKEVKNVSTAEPAKPQAAEEPALPAGFTFVSTGDKSMPGHPIKGADVSRGIPAIVFSCWKGAATDNTRRIGLSTLKGEHIIEVGSKPESLARPFTVDEFSTKDLNMFFAVIGYRSAIIQIGIRFMYLDEKGDLSTLPNTADYLKVTKDKKEMYLIRYHEEELKIQQVYGGGNKQVFIDFVEIPHDHDIDKEVGKHYITFRIAEIIPGQSDYVVEDGIIKPRKIEWLWESEPFEFTVNPKTA